MIKKIVAFLWRAWILAYSVIVLLLVGCSPAAFERTIEGTAVPETNSSVTVAGSGEAAPGLPTKPGYEGRPAAYKVMRLVDPCALHSPVDARRVTELIPDEIMPGDSLNVCELSLIKKVTDLPLWTLRTTVGVDIDDDVRGRGQRQDIADAQYWYLPPRSEQPGDIRDCTYIKEFGPATGLELRVINRDDDDPRDPCAIARDYLLAVTKWWVNPALRAAKVTTPTLPVASVDPCAVAGTVAAELGQRLQAGMSDPHNCTLYPVEHGAKGSFGGLLVVDYTLENDPLAVLSGSLASKYRAITVGGLPGTLTELEMPSVNGHTRSTCYVTVLVDERLSLQADQSRPDSAKTYQVVETRSPDCDLAQRGAEAALAAIG